MIFEAGQTILFIGDSITDAGRRVEAPPYGRGYVAYCRSLLLARYPELGLQIHNRGIGGNTVRDLQARWNEDVLALRPDWLSVKIGINDVWRRFGGDPHQAVPLNEYVVTLRELLLRARDRAGARLIVMEPYVIESDPDEPMRREDGPLCRGCRQPGRRARRSAGAHAGSLRRRLALDTPFCLGGRPDPIPVSPGTR